MSTITTINGTDTITSSRTVINTNFSNLNTDKIETSTLDTDTALTANSDAKIATQKAVKAYVDALGGLTTKTSGVSTGPASSSTQTISHSLSRVPTVIRLTGIGGFIDYGNAASFGLSHGTYNSSGNRCVYIASGGAPLSTSSTTFAVRLSYMNTAGGPPSPENIIASGVVGNVTTSSFDIVWTNTGNASSMSFMWEAN